MNNENSELNNSLKLIAQSSIFIFFGIVFSKFASYLYRIIIARYFGPEVYGLFSIALMISGWLIAFALLGLNSGLFRYISFYRGKKQINKIRYLLKSSSIFLFFTTIFSMTLLFLLSEFIAINIFHNGNLTIFLKLFSISIPLTIFMQYFIVIILSYEKVNWYTTIYYFLDNFIKVISLILLIFIGLGTNAVIFSYISGILVSCIALYFVAKYFVSQVFGKYYLKDKIKTKLKKELFSYSWPFIFSAIIFSIFHWTDTFMIGLFKTVEDVGFYNAAIPIAVLLNFAPEMFLKLFFPLITKEYAKKNIEVIKQLSKQVTKWIFILNLPIFILILIFSKEIIAILFGAQYIVAENALKILSVGMLFSSTFIISQQLIQMIGKSKLLLIDIIILTILNIILNAILIPRYGINGAALSTTGSLIFLNLLILFQARHYTTIIPLRKKMFNITLISIIPLLVSLYIKTFLEINLLSLMLLSFLFLFLYLFLILVTNSFDRNDIFVIKGIFSKISGKLKKQ